MKSKTFLSFSIKTLFLQLLPLLIVCSAFSAPQITRLELFDAKSDAKIKDLSQSAIVDLGRDGYILNIRAAGNGETKSVEFILNGQVVRTENFEPFALAGDQIGDYHHWTPSLGTQEITAIPYSQQYKGGTQGTPYTINFTVKIEYTAIDLDPDNNSHFLRLNDYGVVAGITIHNSTDYTNVIWEDGNRTIIGPPAGHEYTEPFAINNFGTVCGGTYGLQPWVWSDGSRTDIPVSPIDVYDAARALNDLGQVVVNTFNNIYIYENGAATALGNIFRDPADINNNGEIVGPGSINRNPGQAYIYKNNAVQSIGTLGGTYSSAEAINDNGVVTGTSFLSGDLEEHAYTWHNGVFKDLGSFGGRYSLGNDINNAGWVVGFSDIPGTSNVGSFLHDGRTMHALTVLVPAVTTNEYARGINNSGMILTNKHLLVPKGLIRIAGFVLIDAANDKVIGKLKHGDNIDLSVLGDNLNIRADLEGQAGSVQFNLNGSNYRTENIAPYALAGNIGYDYGTWTPTSGTYTLVATPFSGDDASGTVGQSASISFNVLGGSGQSAIDFGGQWVHTSVSVNTTAKGVITQFPAEWGNGWQPSKVVLGIMVEDNRVLDGVSVSANGSNFPLNGWWSTVAVPYTGKNPIYYDFSSNSSRNIRVWWWGE